MDSSVWGKKSKEKKSVPACNFYRETGLYHKTTGPPKYLQWVAEEKLIDKNHEEFTCKLPDGTRSTFLMVFSPDGTMVASTHGNHNVYITYLTNGRNVKTLSGHPRTPWCIAFHPSSNQILASGCLGGQVRVWDLHGGSEIWVVESQTVIASLAFHPTDRVLVIASYNEIHFWDWSQDKPFAKCSTANEREKVRYVSFDKLGHRLITGIANAPRLQSQWDRVAAPQPPPQIRQAEHERRITICYRYMVEQYEQLVQRYYSLSRQGSADQRRNANNRNSQPVTMDRGTDPMEPPPVRTETRCSFCRGDVSGNNGSGTIRGDDGQRPSTSSDSSTPTSEINPTVRPASVNLRNASTQHRGTDEASASRSSSQFLSSHPVLEGVSSVSSNSNTSRSEDLTRQEAIRNARDFNSSIRASYLFNRITRLRDQVETGRDLLLRNAENLARRNLSSLMQPRMSPSSPEYLQGFEDIPPSLYESLPPLSPLPPPSPEETPEDLSIAPPLPAEDPPAPPTPPPLDDPLTPPPPPPPPLEDPVTPPQPPPPPPEDPPTPPPPPPPDDPDHSATLPIPPPPPRPPPTFGFFTRLSAFLLRGQLPPTDVARTTASENSTDSTEGTSNSTERKSNYQHINGNRSVKTNNPENAAQSSTSDTGNTPLSTDCSCPESTSSTSTTTATTTTTTATAAATVLLSLLSSDCRCPESTSSTSTTSATTTTTPTATSGLNKEPPLSSSSSSSINRQSTPRAFRDSGSNTENYESNSSDSASGRVLRRNAESSSAIARLRAQFRRLQSAYNTRDRELMLLREAEERAERRLISRLTALLERSPWINSNNSGPGENSNRPSSAPVTSPLFISQPSSSSTSNPTAARASSSTGDGPSSVPTSMASVRCGLHFLTRHIENLSSQVRVDLERGQANHIRTLWHDLHNQICALSLALRAASAPVEGNSQENNTTNSDPAASSGGNESFPGAARLSSPAANLTALRTPSNNRAEESTSEASTSGTSSVTEEDDDESDVSPRNWFWLRRQSRRPRPHLRIPNAASKRARIDFRFRMGRGGTSRPDNYYSRLRLYDLLGPSDGSNDDDDDDDEDVENERDEDEETVDNAAGVQNVSRSSPNSSNSEGPPNRGIKRKSSRILTRSNITNQQASTAPSPSTSASPDLYYVPARARLNPRVRAFLSLRSQRNAQRQWHHPGYRSQWARDSHLAASESTGDGPSTSRQNNREDTPHREAIRRRARHVLLLMVDSITQFFENDTFTSGSNENLNERTSSLISLLELALELTDLLLTQLDSSRRRRHNYWQTRVDQDYLRTRSEEDRRMRGGINPRRQLSPVMLAMQEQERWDRWISAYTRMFQNNGSGYSRDDHSVRSNSQPLPSSTPVFRISRISATNLYTPLWSLYDSPGSTANNTNNSGNNSSTHRTEIRLPVLRVNDGPVPPDEVTVNHINNRLGGRATSPRGSSPPLFYPPLFRPRLLHPRYLGPYYLDDNSTASEDSSQQENRGGGSSSPGDRPGIERFDREFFLMRGHPTAVLMGDSPMIPHHRIQAWDFTKFTLPEISNAGKNIVVEECKIHNDASVDLSQDGKILVTLLPSGRLSITTMLGVYSLEWDTLGQILYTTSFEQSAVSVSLSPTTRHLIVGLASRRLPFFHTDRQTIAQIFRLEGGRPGCESESPSKGKLVLVRELDISRESTDVTSLNCIRWAPTPGEGFVYGTNSGKLKVLR